ncbi:GspH/FimT family pseudopilin [Sinimarinibacterium thermocellulolyticum]|uniref:Type II secretion system protein H n=1 Tax=Sinimarinibacterium thermocellulolyticum TaxID=3170016 RepID=A0ABV2A884_9GAMM
MQQCGIDSGRGRHERMGNDASGRPTVSTTPHGAIDRHAKTVRPGTPPSRALAWWASGMCSSGAFGRRHASGLTLVELIIGLAVAGILLAVAVPSFRQTMVSNRLSTAANALVESLNQARLEAIRRNATTQFCSSSGSQNGTGALATACGSAGGASYVLNADGSTTLLRAAPALPPNIALGSVTALRYGGQGLARTPGGNVPYTGLVADLSSTAISRDNRRCIYLTTGSALSTCAITSSSGCPSNEPPTCRAR